MKRNLPYSGRKACVILFVLFAIGKSFSQTITISGNTNPYKGAQEYYEASFDYYPDPYTNFSWTINGGYIVSQCINPTMTVWVIVQWNNTDGYGNVSLYDDLTSVSGQSDIIIGDGCHTADAGSNVTVCPGGSGTTIGTAAVSGYTYSWYPTTGLSNAGIAQPTANPSATTTYTLTMTPPNLITNGDFESGATGFSTDLLAYPNQLPQGHGNYMVTTNPYNMSATFCNMSDHTGNGTKMLVVDGEMGNYSANHKMWYTTISVDVNTDYTFSGWVSTASANQESFTATVKGNSGGAASQSYNLSASCGNWTQFTIAWNSGNSTQVTLKLTFNYGNSDLAIDDLYFGTCMQTTDEVVVTMGAIPTISPSGTVTVCSFWEAVSNPAILTSGASGNVQWYKNGSLLSGATSQTYYAYAENGQGNIIKTYNYTVRSNGCESAPTTVQFVPYPAVFSSTNFCRTQPMVFYATNYGSGATYSWNIPGANIQPGTSSRVIQVTFPGQPNSDPDFDVSLTVTNAYGCNGTDNQTYPFSNNCRTIIPVKHSPKSTEGNNLNKPATPSPNNKFITRRGVGKEGDKGRQKTYLYPNPANSHVMIFSSRVIEKVEIYSSSGMPAKRVNGNGLTQLIINIADLSAGMYICMTFTLKGCESLKLMVLR